jgi:hypothetical protein
VVIYSGSLVADTPLATPDDLRAAVRGDWRADADPAADDFAGRALRIHALADAIERIERDAELRVAIRERNTSRVVYDALVRSLVSLIPSLGEGG